jgi:predicted aminopeptidase
MDFLKTISFTIVLMLLSGCAKFDYLYEQSIGQLSLQSRARDNEEMLKNVRVPKDQKEKIVEQYYLLQTNQYEIRMKIK